MPSNAKKIAKINLRLCFPDLDPKSRNKILKHYFRSLGISLVEISMCWWALEKHILNRTKITGLENLKELYDNKIGSILLTAHFTTIEVGGSVINRYLPVGIMYRDQKNKLFNEVMVRARERNCYKVIHRNDIKTLIKALRSGESTWYAPDQHYSGKQFIFSTFFGVPAATTTATARITQLTDARVLPFYQIRLPAYQGYEVIIDKPLQDFPTGDELADTNTINKMLEDRIRRIPEQYLWSHRRFKKMPDNIKSVYK